MKSIVAIFMIIAVGLGAMYFMQKFVNPPASFKKNVKMTVTIETPDGDVSGYAVREISNEASQSKIDWPHGGNSASIRGEAVVVDLGKRGKVFGLLGGGEFFTAFPPPNRRPQSNEAMDYYDALPVGTSAPLAQEYWPEFVMFTDINDPKSVILVRGHKFNRETQKYDFVDNFPQFFGEGVGLKGITLEIINEPVTWEIERILPWLPTVKSGYLNGSRIKGSSELSNNLYYGNFKKGAE